jgi:carbon monoxide dehydrogenase subunit G|tara:strand:- start:1584 stop:2201 length:618 start_codon:yes stop_codon:yes gene_type:complete
MKLSGSYKLNVNKEQVWEALNDPAILKKCIPGCESFTKDSDNVFNATATNQIGPMNATFTGIVTLSNIKPNKSYTLSGEGQSSVGFANGFANVNLSETNGVTSLLYEVDVNVGGKIAQLGSRLINGIAKKMADYFFGRFADLVDPITKKNEFEKVSGTSEILNNNSTVRQKRVEEVNSNFLNKYIYSAVVILILLLVVIFYFVSR